MQNLFHKLPENFFNLLASQSNKELYAGCMGEIYILYDTEISYRMERDIVRQRVQDYIQEHHSDKIPEDADSPREAANLALNRMLHAGWLEEETDTATYTKYISFTEQGLSLAEFMQEIVHPQKEEYSDYIYQIYNTLKHREQWQEHPYVHGVKAVHRNARSMARALKKLSSFLRGIIDRMVLEQSLQSLTENLLEYCEGSFIHEYSRLTRQQNIHLYRTAIREELQLWTKDAPLYQSMVVDCKNEEQLTEEKAGELVLSMISATRRFLTEDYDQMMYDIKQKLNFYINLAVGRARFLLNHEENIRGYVEQTVKYLIQDEKAGGGEELPEELSGCFRLQSYEYLDPNSIRFPRKPREITRESSVELEEVTADVLERAKRQISAEAYNPYSQAQMKSYARRLLGTKERLEIDQFPLESGKDLLSLLSVVVYAAENGYQIEQADEEGYHTTDKLRVRSFSLRRTEDAHDD